MGPPTNLDFSVAMDGKQPRTHLREAKVKNEMEVGSIYTHGWPLGATIPKPPHGCHMSMVEVEVIRSIAVNNVIDCNKSLTWVVKYYVVYCY